MMETWKCDGPNCGFTGSAEEVDRHIEEGSLDVFAKYKEPKDINCWGRELVEEA